MKINTVPLPSINDLQILIVIILFSSELKAIFSTSNSIIFLFELSKFNKDQVFKGIIKENLIWIELSIKQLIFITWLSFVA